MMQNCTRMATPFHFRTLEWICRPAPSMQTNTSTVTPPSSFSCSVSFPLHKKGKINTDGSLGCAILTEYRKETLECNNHVSIPVSPSSNPYKPPLPVLSLFLSSFIICFEMLRNSKVFANDMRMRTNGSSDNHSDDKRKSMYICLLPHPPSPLSSFLFPLSSFLFPLSSFLFPLSSFLFPLSSFLISLFPLLMSFFSHPNF